MRQIRYLIEAAGLYLLLFIFRLMPASWASATGGWIGRTIGPRLAASRKALRNVQDTFPEMEAKEQKAIVKEMWDNLGRIIAEYPHLRYICKNNVTINNAELLQKYRENERPYMMITAHIGNWETASPALYLQLGEQIDGSHRAPNNPWVDRALSNIRSLNGKLFSYAKSREGGRAMMKAMDQKRNIGILIDQKYNEGISVPFFGRPAMTNPVFVKLCQKYNYPLIPVQIERTEGPHFIVTIHDEINLYEASGNPVPIERAITEAHDLLEHWIRNRPAQWLWLHRRWDSLQLGDNKDNNNKEAA